MTTELALSTPMVIIGIVIVTVIGISIFACVMCALLEAFDRDTELALIISYTTFVVAFVICKIYIALLFCGVGVTEVTI